MKKGVRGANQANGQLFRATASPYAVCHCICAGGSVQETSV